IGTRPWVWLVSAFAVFVAALLIGPRVPYERQAEFCVVNVKIGGPLGISLNCDSPEYLRLAREPSALLEPTNMRQSRPGLVLAAPLSPLGDLARRFGVSASRPDIAQGRIDDSLAKDFPGFLAYALLNAGFMLATFWLFQRAADVTAPDAPLGVIFVAVAMLLA